MVLLKPRFMPKVAGYLKTIKVDKGDRVKAGQVLAVLDSPELDHQVENARATYELQKITDDRNQLLLRDRRRRPADR